MPLQHKNEDEQLLILAIFQPSVKLFNNAQFNAGNVIIAASNRDNRLAK